MYGFQIARFSITPRYKTGPEHELSFDNATFGPGGALEFLIGRCAAIKASTGEVDDRQSRFFRIDSLSSGGWVCAITASGGGYGETNEVVNVETRNRTAVLSFNDAVLRQMVLLLVVPSYGKSGVLVSQTRSGSHLTDAFVRSLSRALHEQSLEIRLEREMADEMAWNSFLDQSDVSVEGIELVQHHLSTSGNPLGNRTRIEKAALKLTFNTATSVSQELMSLLRQSIGGSRRVSLNGLIGISSLSEDDFDEQRVIYVQDGKERRINVTQSWPRFTYQITGTEQPTPTSLLDSAFDATNDVLRALGIELSSAWWPPEGNLEPVDGLP